MTYNGEKLGAFIIPTGVGASIGGYAGDASAIARKFVKKSINLTSFHLGKLTEFPARTALF